jgi:hypothetical protein
MTRGYFDFLKHIPAYKDQKKDWHVRLLNSSYFWFDLIIDPPEGYDGAAEARHYMDNLRNTVRDDLDKHFVYFLASRPKVRFNTQRKPHYSSSGKELILYIEIGRERKEQKCIISLDYFVAGAPLTLPARITDRLITFQNADGSTTYSLPIYEFLDQCQVEIGINSEVQYVGYTADPAARALNRKHRGFGDMVYWTSRDDEICDYFIFYNLFNVTSIAINQTYGLNFMVSNAMLDEVDVKSEGKFLEKILIKYFGCKTQELNKPNELGELNNKLAEFTEKHHINSVTFDIEMSTASELFRFFSRAVAATDRHNFTCQLGDSGAEIVAAKDLSQFAI